MFDSKLSGNLYPVAHQLTEPSGIMPTPEIPKIGIWLDVMAVIRRRFKPYNLRYDLAPGVTYSDHGRDLLSRLTKENVLCSSKGLVFARPDPFANISVAELRNGTVTRINLLNQRQTELPTLSVEELMGITLGPLSVDAAMGYTTTLQEKNVKNGQLGDYVNPATFHQQAQQVKSYSFYYIH